MLSSILRLIWSFLRRKFLYRIVSCSTVSKKLGKVNSDDSDKNIWKFPEQLEETELNGPEFVFAKVGKFLKIIWQLILKPIWGQFTIILQTAFTHADPKSTKRQSNQASFCTFGTCLSKSCM